MIRIKYKPNNSEFGKLMMSDQTQDLADSAAGAGVLVATEIARSQGLPAEYINSFKAAPGPPVILGGNPRRTARLHASFPWIEFGSGSKGKSRGFSRKRTRPQGGYSPPYRVLGRTAGKIGKKPTGRGGA